MDRNSDSAEEGPNERMHDDESTKNAPRPAVDDAGDGAGGAVEVEVELEPVQVLKHLPGHLNLVWVVAVGYFFSNTIKGTTGPHKFGWVLGDLSGLDWSVSRIAWRCGQ